MTEENLNFTNFFQQIFKRSWLIILFTFVAGITSTYISYFVIEPVYQAKVNLLVSIKETKDNNAVHSNIDESLKLVATYQDILQSPLILKEAQQELNNQGYNIQIDEENVSVAYKEKSQVLELLVEDKSSTTASLIANAIATAIDEQAEKIMMSKSKNISILNTAAVSDDPVSPQPFMIIGITVIIAFIVSIWITLLIDNISKKRKNS